jgi:hypothetical protein
MYILELILVKKPVKITAEYKTKEAKLIAKEIRLQFKKLVLTIKIILANNYLGVKNE